MTMIGHMVSKREALEKAIAYDTLLEEILENAYWGNIRGDMKRDLIRVRSGIPACVKPEELPSRSNAWMSVVYADDAIDAILIPDVFMPFKRFTLAWAKKHGTRQGVGVFECDSMSTGVYYDTSKGLYTMYSGDPITTGLQARTPGSRKPSLDFSVKVRDKKDCLEMMLKRYERQRG
jgi:hypothetical protein